MKSIVFAALLAIGTAGCQPQSPIASASSTPASASSTPASASSTPAKFQIRDFKIDEHARDFGTTYAGRGTLVALDEPLKKGNLLVWLTVKEVHKADEEATVVVILRDGLATIETSHYFPKAEAGKAKVQYRDWRITGYIRFQDGMLVSEGSEPAPQK